APGGGPPPQNASPHPAMEPPLFFREEPLERFLAMVDLHVDAINQATEGIPAERIRLHVCWGNYDGPHTHDVPLEPLLPRLYRARVGALSLPLANPRHQHEYKVLRKVPPPASMLLLPGVIDSTTNYVEHPEVVADRICQAAEAPSPARRTWRRVWCGRSFARSGRARTSPPSGSGVDRPRGL